MDGKPWKITMVQWTNPRKTAIFGSYVKLPEGGVAFGYLFLFKGLASESEP